MNPLTGIFISILILFASENSRAAEISMGKSLSYIGMCDASAGVAISPDLFLVADDELNVLRVYPVEQGGKPLASLNLDAFLEVDRKSPEADIEGAAKVGDVVYWISSHGRNKTGKDRTSRERFFATQISTNPPYVRPIGRPYKALEDDLLADVALKAFNLAEASQLAPKEKGALNIEGMAVSPEGTLWIGFRNPIIKKKALLVPLLNPDELVAGNATSAKFGTPELIDLGGKGIRDMVYTGEKFFVIAGSYHGGGASEIFQWNGRSHHPKLVYKWEPHELNPEAIFTVPGHENELIVLSDEGAKIKMGIPCKDLPEASRHFRAVHMLLN